MSGPSPSHAHTQLCAHNSAPELCCADTTDHASRSLRQPYLALEKLPAIHSTHSSHTASHLCATRGIGCLRLERVCHSDRPAHKHPVRRRQVPDAVWP